MTGFCRAIAVILAMPVTLIVGTWVGAITLERKTVPEGTRPAQVLLEPAVVIEPGYGETDPKGRKERPTAEAGGLVSPSTPTARFGYRCLGCHAAGDR